MLDSDIALAAVGVTLPLLFIMVSIENIFATGASVLAGRQLGANEKEKANLDSNNNRFLFNWCWCFLMCIWYFLHGFTIDCFW